LADVVVLRIKYPDGRSEERAFAPGTFRIGRELGDLVLGGDPKVSARHAELDIGTGHATITDLGSRNGTLDRSGQKLNGAHRLLVDQPVVLGRSSLTLVRFIAAAGFTEAASEISESPQATLRSARPAPVESQGRRPSITLDRYDGAKRELHFWRLLVNAAGLTFAAAILVAVLALHAGEDPTAFMSGMTTLASGGMLPWLLKRREEALAEYITASKVAAIGTTGFAMLESQHVARGGHSAWQMFRRLPVLMQAVILFHAWWILIPVWLMDLGSKDNHREAGPG
jgi:hypothetical protein